MKVFWSWQSDTDEKLNKHFVRDALADALAKVSKDLDLSEADRPELDHDTKGTVGMVSIVDTIFKKIEEAAIFVGDITFVGETPKSKKLPNPNVMIELGHAITSLGPERIILVSNGTYGGRPEDLPFDLRHRRGPITYKLASDVASADRKAIKARLATDLAGAIAGSLGQVIEKRTADAGFPMQASRPGDRSTWLPAGAIIRHQEWFNGDTEDEWEVSEQPRSYMRICPANYLRTLSVHEIHEISQDKQLFPLGPMVGVDGGVNGPGIIKVGNRNANSPIAFAVTQWFEDTGEIWGFNGAATYSNDGGKAFVCASSISREWLKFMNRAFAFMEAIGVKGPWQVEAGVVGLKDVFWSKSTTSGVRARKEEVYLQRTDIQWKQETRRAFLLDIYNTLCDNFNQPHYNPQQFKQLCP